MRSRVVFVDDEECILNAFRRMLRHQSQDWDMAFFSEGVAAWNYLQSNSVDAVVSDVSIPGLSGFELLSNLRSHAPTADLPFAMLTGSTDTTLKRRALDMGATDLLSKPIESSELTSRIQSMIRLKRLQDQLKKNIQDLDSQVRRRTRQLEYSRMQIVWRLGKAAEFRDEETGEHVARVACCSRLIARALGKPSQYLDELFLAAPLHDIGKIGISDTILLKPGKLTDEERRTMQTHCEIGARILHERSLTELYVDNGLDFGDSPVLATDTVMKMAHEVALFHHERWDGTGYPFRIRDRDIPLGARIVAVADVFDALTSDRPYKRAFSIEEAIAIIHEGRGTQFDPEIVDAFLDLQDEMAMVRTDLSVSLRQSTASSMVALLGAD